MAKILITDDERDMRLALANTLELAGYSVIDAGSGKEALEKLKTESVDLMLLDIRLPDMDGVQILKKVKAEHPGLPVIMVTGFGSLETAVQTVQLGASDYLPKPFENKDLFQKIEKALGARALKASDGPITSRLMRELGVEPVAVEVNPEAVPVRPTSAARRGLGWGLLALIVALGGAALGHRWWSAGEASYGIPTSHLSGIAADGERVWLGDWFSQTVYECRLEGGQLSVQRSYPLGETRPTGLAASGDALYIGDSWAKTLSRRALDANLSVVASAASPGQSPAGLAWDGERLWSSDTGDDTAFRHSATDFKVQTSVRARGTNPVGVGVQGGALWIADADTRRVYRHKLDEQFTPDGVYTHALLKESSRPLSAFLLTDGDAWFGFEGVNRVYRVRIGRLEKVAP